MKDYAGILILGILITGLVIALVVSEKKIKNEGGTSTWIWEADLFKK